MDWKKTLAALAVASAAAGLYWGLSSGALPSPDAGEGEEERAARSTSTVLDEAPVVPFATLDGDTVSLADHEGEVVLLNFWGTWCPPCRREVPDLVEVQERLEGRGATVVGLAVESGPPAEIRAFMEEFGINYPVWIGRTGTVTEEYRVIGFPTTLLIDREGKVQKRYMGPQSAEKLLADLEPYL